MSREADELLNLFVSISGSIGTCLWTGLASEAEFDVAELVLGLGLN